LKVICESYNHELIDILVGHPYDGRLKPNEHFMHVDMTKNLVKLISILLTLKENNEDNVIVMKQVYNIRYVYKRSYIRSLTNI